MQRNRAQLWGKQGARGALIAGAAAVTCCLPALASAAPASPALAGAGLWVASDNYGGNTSCGGSPDHAGICFLSY